MNNKEEKIKSWIEQNVIYIAFGAIFFCGIIIRGVLRNYVSPDAQIFLLPWYEEIKNNGGLKGLGTQVGNYNLLYQFFIAIFTYLPINSLYSYKIFSCIFDIAVALLGAVWVRNICKADILKTFFAFSLIFLSPIVILNSSLWAQCDSIYSFFCMLTLYLLFQKKYWRAMFFYGAAFSFKLQAIFILPFILLFYIKDKDFSIKYFTGSIITVIGLSLPGLMSGRNVLDILKVYTGQVTTNPDVIFYNYPGFCNLFVNGDSLADDRIYIKNICLIMAICVVGIICVFVIQKKIKFDEYSFLYIAFLLTFATVLFLPAMHERYGYIYEVLSILILIYDTKTIFLSTILHTCTIITYCNYLFNIGYNVKMVSIINMLVFLIYVWYYFINPRKKVNNKDVESIEI